MRSVTIAQSMLGGGLRRFHAEFSERLLLLLLPGGRPRRFGAWGFSFRVGTDFGYDLTNSILKAPAVGAISFTETACTAVDFGAAITAPWSSPVFRACHSGRYA